MGKLDNRVAVVTGAAVGNGCGAAFKLAEHGAKVMLFDVQEVVFDTAKKINEKFGVDTEAFIADVRDVPAIQKAVDTIIAKHSKIDILFNNAGVTNIVSFLNMSDEVRDRMFGVNIIGVWNCTKAVLPHMVKANYGKIVNMSSVTGPIVVDTGQTAYAATKAAVLGFTKALAMEVALNNITVNAICPGYILTPMVRGSAKESNPDDPQKVIDGTAAMIPMKRLGTIEEIGDLVAFLSSDESRYITGTQIVIDGGSTLPETFGAKAARE